MKVHAGVSLLAFSSFVGEVITLIDGHADVSLMEGILMILVLGLHLLLLMRVLMHLHLIHLSEEESHRLHLDFTRQLLS
jgi:hypothetical protein